MIEKQERFQNLVHRFLKRTLVGKGKRIEYVRLAVQFSIMEYIGDVQYTQGETRVHCSEQCAILNIPQCTLDSLPQIIMMAFQCTEDSPMYSGCIQK